MNFITIILWITIVIIAVIAIIIVKLHYRGNELENEEGSILPSSESISNALNFGNRIKNDNEPSNEPRSLSPKTSQQSLNNSNLFKTTQSSQDEDYIVPKQVENNDLKNFEYSSQNQVLINYDNKVEKFQEPIKQSQIDIMTQNNKDNTELKDLFTIDELIKESKRKDSEREKESQTIPHEEDKELAEIKESIKNKTEEPLIEEVIAEDKQETISDAIKESEGETESEPESVASQKDVDEAITAASQESEDGAESDSEEKYITTTLLNQEPKEGISEPALKTPNKVDEDELGSSIDDVNLFGETKTEQEYSDLDYRKDLDKFTNKIKGSKIFQEVKDKLTPETPDIPPMEEPHEQYIRNVNDYDEYEPIINETHQDFDSYEEYHDLDNDERLRQENTRRVFNMAKNSSETELAKPRLEPIKNKPSRDNIKVTINNDDFILKKGDEIIFNHDGETYSSQVYAINGDDISVKYRRKNIKIKPSDVKKIY